jgi:hypothetical protein
MRILVCEVLLAVAMIGCGGGGSPVGAQAQPLVKETFWPTCSETFVDPRDGEVVTAPLPHMTGNTACAANGDQFVCNVSGNWQPAPPIACGDQCGVTLYNACGGVGAVCPPCPECPCGGDFPNCADCCPEPPGCSPDWGG